MSNYSRELWAVAGPGFVLPIGVVWEKENEATVRTGCGLALLKSQQHELALILNKAGTPFRNAWIIRREALEPIAKKMENEDPERVVCWTPRENLATRFEVRSSNWAMMEHMVRWGWFKSIGAAELIWQEFCRAMMNALIVDKEKVDFGFAEMREYPYRVNWREKMFAAKFWLGKRGFNAKWHITASMCEKAFDDHCLWEALFAWGDTTVTRSLSIRTKKLWVDGVEKSEKLALSELSLPRYVQRITGEIIRRKEEARADYLEWCQEIFAPYRVLPRNLVFQPPGVAVQPDKHPGESWKPWMRKGSKGKVKVGLQYHRRMFGRQSERKNRTRPLPTWDLGSMVLERDGFKPIVLKSDHPPISDMLEMPNVRPTVQDVRDEWSDVLESEFGIVQTRRVLVRNVSGRYESKEVLLAI